MTETELFNAMRPGSRSPLEDRDPADLGRFGLGLKTASFSQSRILSVVSKAKRRKQARRSWNLDYVAKHDEWRLLKDVTNVAESRSSALDDLPSGTVVVWENLDRIVDASPASNDRAQMRFLHGVNGVREHLAMTFHRFLSGPHQRLNIWINGNDKQHLVKPWDPFFEDHPCTTCTPVDPVTFGGAVVSIRGYVLPHKDKLGDKMHKIGTGPRGWNAQQGFYIYRNDRMLVSGDWLRLGRERPWTREEHYKLARLSIDIPNSMDSDWALDVKKSTATPPMRKGSSRPCRRCGRSPKAAAAGCGTRSPGRQVARPIAIRFRRFGKQCLIARPIVHRLEGFHTSQPLGPVRGDVRIVGPEKPGRCHHARRQ